VMKLTIRPMGNKCIRRQHLRDRDSARRYWAGPIPCLEICRTSRQHG